MKVICPEAKKCKDACSHKKEHEWMLDLCNLECRAVIQRAAGPIVHRCVEVEKNRKGGD